MTKKREELRLGVGASRRLLGRSWKKDSALDEWTRFVLSTMSAAEIRDVLASGEETDPRKLSALRAELLRKETR